MPSSGSRRSRASVPRADTPAAGRGSYWPVLYRIFGTERHVTDPLALLATALEGRYVIEREIGSGGTAVVFRARDLRHHRLVAIKVLRPELARSLGPDRFLREIRIAASLTHPHILPVHDSGEAAELLYYVMPYVEGESLRSRLIREGALPMDDALRIAREVADALSYAHSRGVVHRDIKPGNILLVGGHAVVADFGIATATDIGMDDETLTSPGLVIGTPAYMSPEQARGEPMVDGRSDLYSLGCVLYEMLTGRPPFTGPSAQAVLARHSHDAPEPLRPQGAPPHRRTDRVHLPCLRWRIDGTRRRARRSASRSPGTRSTSRHGSASATVSRWMRASSAIPRAGPAGDSAPAMPKR
jgi:serine/threonine protein kinase